ncbi:MAG TPA: hypothetical protein VLK35_06295 [Methylomirabilota bacterium]|nr:hypothetical protein [Methylomirabilota bacterium]
MEEMRQFIAREYMPDGQFWYHQAIADLLKAYDAAQAEIARLREAATALLVKLDAVHADGRYAAVWQISQMHVGPYDGPKYEVEMAALRAALTPPTP